MLVPAPKVRPDMVFNVIVSSHLTWAGLFSGGSEARL